MTLLRKTAPKMTGLKRIQFSFNEIF